MAMLDTKQKVISRIEQLSSLATVLSKAPAAQVLQLRDVLLALPDDRQWDPSGRSGLNADGSPLQYCISTAQKGWAGRFISDPACIIGHPGQRYRFSYQALQQLYLQSQSQAIQEICEEMLRFHLPQEQEELEDYPDGVLWLGASPDGPGMAVYMDGRRGGHEVSWQRFQEWLHHLMPHNTEVDSFIASLSPLANIMSIGLEGSSMDNLRAKLYFRLGQSTGLKSLGVELLQNEAFAHFLNDVIGTREIRLSGLVFSIGFHIASGKLFDAKMDVCGCNACAGMETAAWLDVLQRTTSRHQLCPFPIEQEVLEHQCAVSYYGIGMDRRGEIRMNLYLKNKIL